MAGCLSEFRTQTGYVACDLIRCLGEAAAPGTWRTDWASFQTQLEELIPFDSELHDVMAIDTCVENFSGAVLKALAASTPKRRACEDPRPL